MPAELEIKNILTDLAPWEVWQKMFEVLQNNLIICKKKIRS